MTAASDLVACTLVNCEYRINILWAEMVMGRNGYGPKWSWAEMVMGRNDRESFDNNKKIPAENCHFYSCEILQYVVWVCFHNVKSSSTQGLACLTTLPQMHHLHAERFRGSAESFRSFFLSSTSTSSHAKRNKQVLQHEGCNIENKGKAEK